MRTDLLKEKLKKVSREELEEIKWLLLHPEYSERPVDIETFVNHPYYLGLKFTTVGNKGYGCRPRILERLRDVFDPKKKYEEFVFMCGIGWGKDFASSIVLTYQLYRLACYKNPQEFFGLAKGSSIHLMLMSINETHARDVLFGEVRARIDNSEWFKKNFPYDKKIVSSLKFSKNIFLIPGNSKDTTFVGYNIFTAIIDEGDDYTVTPNRNDAVEGYNAIKDRIVSRFRNKGLLGIIGSPKVVGGFMMSMYKNEEGIPNRYRVWVETWDSLLDTPLLSGEIYPFRGINVPIEYKHRFISDPERAMRDLAARPMLAKQPFITMPEYVDKIFDEDRQMLFETKDDEVKSFAKFIDGIKGNEEHQYFCHLDLAVNRKKGDRLGFAVGHVGGFKEIDGQEKPIIDVDIAMVITAPPGGEILFSDVKQLVFYLKDVGFNFKVITSDSWQSVDMIQSFNSRGLKSEILSVDKTLEPYDTTKSAIYDQRVRCHKNELLKNEIKRLDLINGEKVDHPADFSKDCADAVCGVIYKIMKSNNARIINFNPSFGAKREF